MTILLLLCSGLAMAAEENGSVDVELFVPNMDNSGYLTVPGATTLGHLELGAGLWLNHSNDPLVLTDRGERIAPVPGTTGDKGDGLIDSRLRSELQVGMGFAGWFSFNMGVPFVISQSGTDPSTLSQNTLTPLPSAGLGDIRLEAVGVPLSSADSPVGVAIRLPLEVPSGRQDALMGEGGLSFSPSAVVELANGNVARHDHTLRAAVQAGYALRPADRLHDLRLGNAFTYGMAAGVHPTEVLELTAELHGEIGGPGSSYAPGELLGALHFFGGDMVDVRVGGGTGLFGGVGAPDWRFVAGVTVSPTFDPSARDADHDGVADDVDRCPDVPEDIDRYRDDDGCPDKDNDADNIEDSVDECPDDPEDDDDFEDKDGCPDKDNDNDGVPDISDRCPMAPETLNDYRDEDGCPDEPEYGDRDGDGYGDDVDRCPHDAEDRDGFQDEDGCPDKDNDNDGILDAQDRCPNEREIFNGVDDEDGCPEKGRVSLEGNAIKITERIYFETGRDTIQQRSFGLLDEIASVLQSNPQLKKVRIEGHTDNIGNELTNLRLSQARADAVRTYLIQAGVEAARLEARGFGESYPLVGNDTEDGRAQNRRVEFIIVDRK